MEIESVGELLYACQENRLLLYKGFGEKTQAERPRSHRIPPPPHRQPPICGYRTLCATDRRAIKKSLPRSSIGPHRRVPPATGDHHPTSMGHDRQSPKQSNAFLDSSRTQPRKASPIRHASTQRRKNFSQTLFETSCSGEFLEALREKAKPTDNTPLRRSAIRTSRPALYPALPPRTTHRSRATDAHPHSRSRPSDIRAIIHSHSKWSDGSNTLAEMAAACIEKGFEYLVISDHSKTACYANGLKDRPPPRTTRRDRRTEQETRPLRHLQKHRERYPRRWRPRLLQ